MEDEDESNHEVFRDGKVHLCERKCSTCIYRPGNLMRLDAGRKEGMETEAVANQSVIPCHKTIFGQAVGPAICRGYWDTQKHNVGILSAAERMGMITEVDPG